MMMLVCCPDQADTHWWKPQLHGPVPGGVQVAQGARAWRQPLNANIFQMLATRKGQSGPPQQQWAEDH